MFCFVTYGMLRIKRETLKICYHYIPQYIFLHCLIIVTVCHIHLMYLIPVSYAVLYHAIIYPDPNPGYGYGDCL